jgi:hypothetical protein
LPRASRPRFGGYGVPDDDTGLLPWSWAAERLASARNYWIATAGPPRSTPVWALWTDGALLFSCDPASKKARAIARDKRVAVHLESGEEVVIVHGEAEPFTLTQGLADAYERKYSWKVEPGEGWYRVAPKRVLAWTEAAFPKDATRFDF